MTTPPAVSVAVFDVSGTLVSGNAWRGITLAPQIPTSRRRWLMGTNLPIYLAWKTRLYSEYRFRDHWIRALASLLRGYTHAEVNTIFDWGVNTYLIPHYRQDVVDELQALKANGTTVLIVSNIFQGFVDLLVQRLGADDGVGTTLAYADGVATGGIDGIPSAGQQKVDNVNAWLQKHGHSIDLTTDAAAYADSISDSPLLSAVKHATATYPDGQLRHLAIQKNWRILG